MSRLNSERLYLEWVADYGSSREIFEQLNSGDFFPITGQEESLASGFIKYQYVVKVLSPEAQVEELLTLVRRKSPTPLIVGFNFVGLSQLKQRKYAQGLEEILIAYLRYEQNLPVDEVKHIYFDDPETLLIEPLERETGEALFLGSEEREALVEILGQLDDYVGYTLLTPDPLVWYYLETRKIKPDDWYLTSWYGLALIPLEIPSEEETSLTWTPEQELEEEITPLGYWSMEADLFIRETFRFTASLRRQGYTRLEIGTNYYSLVQEIARLWSIRFEGIFEDPENRPFLVVRPERSLGTEISGWLFDAVRRVQRDRLPLLYYGGDWTQYVEPTLENMARIQYAAIRAYHQMAKAMNETLVDYLWQVKLLPSLLVVANFFRLEEVVEFENLFSSYLSEMKSWRVVACSDLLTCARRRAKIITQHPELQPLGLSIPADPDHYYLVVNIGLAEIEVPDIGDIYQLGEEEVGTSEEGQRGLIPRREQPRPQPQGKIEFIYYPAADSTYTFVLANEITLLSALTTEEPIRVLSQLEKQRPELLSSWGESYLRLYPEAPLERNFFRSEEEIRRLIE